MADRYLISAAGTNLAAYWSTTSGGGGGASVPTSADKVIIDAGTPAGAQVLGAALTCHTFDYSAYPTALQIRAAINFHGHWRGNGIPTTGTPVTITAAAITTNGGLGWDIDMGSGLQMIQTGITWDWGGNGGRWEIRSFGFHIGLSSSIRRIAGEWNTNDYAITCGAMTVTGAGAKTGSAGTSILTFASTNTAHSNSGSNDTWDYSNATIDIRATANQPTWRPGLVIGEVRSSAAGWVHVGAPGTIGTLRRTGTASQLDGWYFSGNVAIGTFISNGNSKLNALWVRSSAYGVARTLTVTTMGSVTNTFFEDIIGAGAASWDFSAQDDIGDMKGNSGIVFPASRLLDRDNTAGAWETDARWVDFVTRAAASFPLPQDDVQLTGNGNITSSGALRLCRDLDMSAWTGILTRTSSASTYHLLGSFSGGGSHGSAPNTFYLDMRTRTPLTITCNGTSFFPCTANQTLTIYALGTTITGLDQFVYRPGGTFTSQISIVAGTFKLDPAASPHQLCSISSVATTHVRGFDFAGAHVETYTVGATNLLNISSGNFTLLAANSVFEVKAASGATRSIVCGFTFGEIRYTVANSPGQLNFVTASETKVDYLNIAPGSSVGLGLNTHLVCRQGPAGGANFGGQQYNVAVQDASNLVSQPDATPLRITGDITLDYKVTASDWSPAGRWAFGGKINGALTTGWCLRLSTTGSVEIICGGVTGGQQSTAGLAPFANGDTGWIRFQRNAATGAFSAWSSPDGVTWTSLGAITSSTAGPLIANTTDALIFGARGAGGDVMPVGTTLHRALVYDALMGTAAAGSSNVVSDADFENKAVGADSFTESSVNAATVSIGPNLRNNDGRLAFVSNSPGTPGWLSILERPTWDYVKTKDIFGTVEGKLYVGANGMVDTGCTNVQTGTFDPTAPYIRQYLDVAASGFPFPVTPGNMLVGAVTTTGGSPTYVTPPGYTLVRPRNSAPAPGQIEAYKRTADGSETTFTTTSTGGAVAVKCWEVVGADTLDVDGENSGTAVTTLDASAAPLTTYGGGKTLGIGLWSGNAIGVSGAFTDGYGESRLPTLSSHFRAATRALPASASTNPNFSWTGNQNPRSQLLIFKSAGGSVSYQAITAASTGSALLVNMVNKPLSFASVSTPTIRSQVSKYISVASSAIATLTKLIPKTLTATNTGTPTVVKSLVKFVNITVTGTSASTIRKSVFKPISANGVSTLTFTVSARKSLTTSATGTTTIAKAFVKVLSAISVSSASMARSTATTLSINAVVALTVVKRVSTTLISSVTGIPSIVKQSSILLTPVLIEVVVHPVATLNALIFSATQRVRHYSRGRNIGGRGSVGTQGRGAGGLKGRRGRGQ